MRLIRPALAARQGGTRRRRSSVLAAAAVTAVLALTATACGPGEDEASDKPSSPAGQASDGKITIPDDLKNRLKEHGIDLDQWKNG
ncbi:hypothetical protein ACIOG9_19070, partial [Streptomyces sp. NPDC088178]